jgi:hypothetical protein
MRLEAKYGADLLGRFDCATLALIATERTPTPDPGQPDRSACAIRLSAKRLPATPPGSRHPSFTPASRGTK